MEIGEIISDSIHYPIEHVKSLLVYIVIIIVMTLISILTTAGLYASSGLSNVWVSGIIAFLGVVLSLTIGLLVFGYGLDIVKLGIEQSYEAPEIEMGRQIKNGLKYLITLIVYFIIPFLVMILLSYFNFTVGAIVGIILFIVFGLAALMAECRLAESEDLTYALNIPDAIGDIREVGILKLIAVLVIIVLIAFILSLVVSIIAQYGGTAGAIIGGILDGVISAYLFFFANRATGLLYSQV